MSKLIPSVSGLACVIWIAVWSWGLSKENTNQSSNHIAAPSIRIADTDSVFTAKEVFSFHLSDEKPVLPVESLDMLKQVAQYIAAQPNKLLTLTGSYLPMPLERNQSPHPNLGIARANAIKDILVGEGGDPDRIMSAAQEVQNHLMMEGRILGGVEFDFSNAPENTVDTVAEEVTPVVKEATNKQPEAKKSSNAALIITYDYKDFGLAKKNRPDLDELRVLVRDNPSYRLNITGYSSKDEEKEVTGLAERRSLAVRRYLVDSGVRRRNIIVESHPGTAKEGSERRVEISIIK